MKRYLLIFILFILLVMNISCVPNNNGNDNNYGNSITCSEDRNQAKCSDPETWDWRYNRTDFDGKGITIKLLHGNPKEIDPNAADFIGDRKAEKSYRLYEIQDAYNINLSIERFPVEVSWGTNRVEWINNLGKNIGHIFAVSSSWIPQLAEKESIAILENVQYNEETTLWEQINGFFTDFNYNASQNKLANNYNNKVYGYSLEEEHADYFLYYNQDLIDEYNLDDPATLWNEGKWDWTTFYNFLETAQQAFDENRKESDPKMYAYGGFDEFLIKGIFASKGGKLVDLENKKVNFYTEELLEVIERLKSLKNSKMYSLTPSIVCGDFINGNQLFQPGELWYLTSTMRFVPENATEEKMNISVVPYPTADGDASTKSLYKIPRKPISTYVVSNISNGENGLNSKVLFNILDDFLNALPPVMDYSDVQKEDRYKTYLSEIIESKASVDAIMSVEENLDKYGYFEYIDEVEQYLNTNTFMYEYWYLGLLNEGSRTEFILSNNQEKYQKALNKLIG